MVRKTLKSWQYHPRSEKWLENKPPPLKMMKKQKAKPNVFNDNKDNDKPSKQITIQSLFIESTVSTLKSWSSKAAASAATKTLQQGPIFHNITDKFDVLLATIAKHAPCAIKNLLVLKMQWKFETPLGGLWKLLANDTWWSGPLLRMACMSQPCFWF